MTTRPERNDSTESKTTTETTETPHPEPDVGYLFRYGEGIAREDEFLGYCVRFPAGSVAVRLCDTVRAGAPAVDAPEVYDDEPAALTAVETAFPRADVWAAWDL